LQDWQVTPSDVTRGKKQERHLVMTVTYKVVS